MNTLFPPPSGRPRPHRIKTRRLIIALTCAFATHPSRRTPSAPCRGAFCCNEPQKMCTKPTLADAPATNLKKCAAGARAGARSRAEGGGRRAPARNPRTPADDRRPPGARRRKAVSCTFFSVCCAVARRFALLRGRSGRLRRRPFYKPFHNRSSDLRFCSRRPEAGRLGCARLCNKPKKCARNGAFADKRATNRKKCAASARAAARPRVQAAARGVAAHACGSRTRGRPQVVASRNPRPAARNLHQLPLARDGRDPSARRRSGEAQTRQPGDLWRFRKAKVQEDEP